MHEIIAYISDYISIAMLHKTRTYNPVPSRDRTRSRLGTGKGPLRVIICLLTLWSFLFTTLSTEAVAILAVASVDKSSMSGLAIKSMFSKFREAALEQVLIENPPQDLFRKVDSHSLTHAIWAGIFSWMG